MLCNWPGVTFKPGSQNACDVWSSCFVPFDRKHTFDGLFCHTAGADSSMCRAGEFNCSQFLFFSPSDLNAGADNQR